MARLDIYTIQSNHPAINTTIQVKTTSCDNALKAIKFIANILANAEALTMDNRNRANTRVTTQHGTDKYYYIPTDKFSCPNTFVLLVETTKTGVRYWITNTPAEAATLMGFLADSPKPVSCGTYDKNALHIYVMCYEIQDSTGKPQLRKK